MDKLHPELELQWIINVTYTHTVEVHPKKPEMCDVVGSESSSNNSSSDSSNTVTRLTKYIYMYAYNVICILVFL